MIADQRSALDCREGLSMFVSVYVRLSASVEKTRNTKWKIMAPDDFGVLASFRIQTEEKLEHEGILEGNWK